MYVLLYYIVAACYIVVTVAYSTVAVKDTSKQGSTEYGEELLSRTHGSTASQTSAAQPTTKKSFSLLLLPLRGRAFSLRSNVQRGRRAQQRSVSLKRFLPFPLLVRHFSWRSLASTITA